MKKIVSIVLFVIAIVMIGFGFYILNSNKYIFGTVLSKSLDYVVDSYYSNDLVLDGMSNISKYKTITNTNLKVLDEEMLSLTGNLYISNNKFYLDLDSNVVGKKFIGLESLIDENRVYLKLKEAMDKFYYMDLVDGFDSSSEGTIDISGIINLDNKDLKILINQLEKSILQDLVNDDFESNSETLTINNKRFKTNHISLKLSAKELRQIIINLLENISNDNKSIQVLQKVNENITKDDITSALDSFRQMSSGAVDEDILDISFYISGVSDVVRVELSTLNNEIDSIASDNLSIIIDSYNNASNKQVNTVTFKENNSEILKHIATKISDNNSTMKTIINDGTDTVIVEGTYSKTSSLLESSFDLLLNDEKLANLTYRVSEIINKKEYKMEINVSTIDSSITFYSANNIHLNENIPNIDIGDSDNFGNMSQGEIERINDFISSKLIELGLEDYLSSFGTNDNYVEETEYSTYYYEIIKANDIKDLIKSSEPVVVWFGSQSCSHCITFSEVLNESYWDYYYDINYIDITTLSDSDLDMLRSLDDKLDIKYTPTIVVLQNGKVKDINVGSMNVDNYYRFLDDNGVK